MRAPQGDIVRVLYADDNVDHLDLFRAALRPLGGAFDVVHAHSGAEALARLSHDRVDLVVLDFRLPDCTGLELLRRLGGPGRPPVVMITGAGDEKTAVAAMKAGAYDYVVKDELLGSELPRAIASALERHREERRHEEERARLAELAFTDPLTGLRNRRFFNETFEREFATAVRYGRSLSLLILDFDHFKSVNDRHGHATGDRVLAESAKALQAIVRSSDLVARYGGEEFVVVLPDTDEPGARILADRMRSAVSSIPFPVADGSALRVTISLGLAVLPAGGGWPTSVALLAAADGALYAAKANGRDRLEVAAAAD